MVWVRATVSIFLSAIVKGLPTLWPKRQTSPTWSPNLGRPAVRDLLYRFLRDESAATAIEYGLIAAGISLAIIAVVSNLGTKLKSTFSSISTQLK